MNTGMVNNWDGNLIDIGPIYPFVGWEVLMVVLGFIFWIGWHYLQMRAENEQLDQEARRLRQSGDLQKLLQAERLD
jgi:hypothetical protein